MTNIPGSNFVLNHRH